MGNAQGRLTFTVLAVLSLGSGCAALIYEVVWYELLRQVIGASPLSLAVVLAGFMSGLAIGSYGFGRLVGTRSNALNVYAVLEIGIGACAAALLIGLPLVRHVYISFVGYGMTGTLLRALIGFMCLLPPTILMGATLPALARWTGATRRGVSRLGVLYAANTIGAATGAMLAGTFLLRYFDVAIVSSVAISLNLLVGVAALLIARTAAPGTNPAQNTPRPTIGPSSVVHLTIALSGATAIGAQVVWTRLLALMFGATVYTFAIILTVFLIGLGIGSGAASLLIPRGINPGRALAWSQFGLVLTISFAAFSIDSLLPYWSLSRQEAGASYAGFTFDVARALTVMLPATVLWGASFPFALAAARAGASGPASLTGRIYAANTLGSIIGALGISLVVIPLFGSDIANALLVGAAGAASLLMLGYANGDTARRPSSFRTAGVVSLTAAIIALLPAKEPRLIGFGHDALQWQRDNVFTYASEGRSASVAVSESAQSGYRYFHVDGKVVASNTPEDMRLQVLLGHLPALLHPRPKSVLVVGFGAGVTAGSFVHYPTIEKIVICEIEPRVVDAARAHFGEENHRILDDPRVELVFDDARHYVATSDQRFDIITSDPIHPWIKGAAALYSEEYFEQVRSRLNPGGIVTQWIPLYQTNESAVKSQLATFARAFPEATVWHNDLDGKGYDLIALGSSSGFAVEVAELYDRFRALPKLEAELGTAGIESHWKLVTLFLARTRELAPWLADAEINRDRNLRLQYLAGLAVDRFDADRIYRAMSEYKSELTDSDFATPVE